MTDAFFLHHKCITFKTVYNGQKTSLQITLYIQIYTKTLVFVLNIKLNTKTKSNYQLFLNSGDYWPPENIIFSPLFTDS